MAELSRLRGANTEEQLLELQRAFLESSDQRSNAAARVTRVGGSPPIPHASEAETPPIPHASELENDGGEGGEGGEEGDGGGGEWGEGGFRAQPKPQEAGSIVGEVVERERGEDGRGPPVGPTPPAGGAGLAFPAATHRSKGPFAGRKSKFMLEREARLAGGGGGAARGAAAAPGAPTMTFVTATPVGRRTPDAEGAGVEEETARRLAAMSMSEIEEAQSALVARLKPSALQFLKKRAAQKRGGEPPPDTAQYQRPEEGAPSAPSKTKQPTVSLDVPPPSPTEHVATAAAAAVREKERRTSAAAANSFGGSSAPNVSRGGTRGEAPTDVAAVRYTFEGAPLNAEDHPAAARAASRLGSAVERDPLRAGFAGAPGGAGVEGPAPGYTLGESLDLARSSFPAQRVAGLSLLSRVLSQARRWGGGAASGGGGGGGPLGGGGPTGTIAPRKSVGMAGLYGASGAPSSPMSLPPPLPVGVTWGDVWLHALVEHNAVLVLRRALDDPHLPAAAAAAGAVAALVGGATGGGGSGSGGEDAADAVVAAADWFDALECSPPTAVSLTSCAAPLWRSGGWGATFAPLAWEAASGPIRLRDDGTVEHDPADEERSADGGDDDSGDPGASGGGPPTKEERRSRGMAHAADPVASLLRMGLLPRCRYLLEVGRHPAAVAPVLILLAACARHSPPAATAVARCPRLLQVLVAIASGPSAAAAAGDSFALRDGVEFPPGSAAAAARVLRILAASAPEHARRLGADGVPSAAIQSAVAAGSPRTPAGAGAWIEAIRLWAAVAAGGGTVPSVDGLYPLLSPMMEPLPLNAAIGGHGGYTFAEAATAAALAAEAFALMAALVPQLPSSQRDQFAKPQGWVPPVLDPETSEEEGEGGTAGAHEHPSMALTMSSDGIPLSWSCATGVAGQAETWVTSPPPPPPTMYGGCAYGGHISEGGGGGASGGAPGGGRGEAARRAPGYSPAAWRAAGAAAHFLAALVSASVVGGGGVGGAGDADTLQHNAAVSAAAAGRRVLGLDHGPAAGGAPPGGATQPPGSDRGGGGAGTGGGVLAPSGLAAAALDALGSGSNDGTDAALAGRAAIGMALYGALRLVALIPLSLIINPEA